MEVNKEKRIRWAFQKHVGYTITHLAGLAATGWSIAVDVEKFKLIIDARVSKCASNKDSLLLGILKT